MAKHLSLRSGHLGESVPRPSRAAGSCSPADFWRWPGWCGSRGSKGRRSLRGVTRRDGAGPELPRGYVRLWGQERLEQRDQGSAYCVIPRKSPSRQVFGQWGRLLPSPTSHPCSLGDVGAGGLPSARPGWPRWIFCAGKRTPSCLLGGGGSTQPTATLLQLPCSPPQPGRGPCGSALQGSRFIPAPAKLKI